MVALEHDENLLRVNLVAGGAPPSYPHPALFSCVLQTALRRLAEDPLSTKLQSGHIVWAGSTQLSSLSEQVAPPELTQVAEQQSPAHDGT